MLKWSRKSKPTSIPSAEFTRFLPHLLWKRKNSLWKTVHQKISVEKGRTFPNPVVEAQTFENSDFFPLFHKVFPYDCFF